jgi:hypothetical protein
MEMWCSAAYDLAHRNHFRPLGKRPKTALEDVKTANCVEMRDGIGAVGLGWALIGWGLASAEVHVVDLAIKCRKCFESSSQFKGLIDVGRVDRKAK